MSVVEQPTQPIDDSVLAMALASGATHVAAAQQAQTSERTVRRKLADPAFRALVGDYRNQLIAGALGRMAESMTRAADALVAMLDAPEAHIRVRAARSLLSLGVRLQDSVDTANRIQAVEVELERRGGFTS